jgi:hypothetical protein
MKHAAEGEAEGALVAWQSIHNILTYIESILIASLPLPLLNLPVSASSLASLASLANPYPSVLDCVA